MRYLGTHQVMDGAMAKWAYAVAEAELSEPLPRRWEHSQGVARRAAELTEVLGEDADLLASAAVLHDVSFAEADHEGGAAVEDVAAPAHDGLGGEHDGLADEVVLGVLERGAGHRDDGAGQFVEGFVAAVAVLGVLDDADQAAGEAVVDVGEGGGEVAADVEEGDGFPGGPGFEVVQRGVRVGEQFAGQGVDGDGPLGLALGSRVDGLRLGQHRGEPRHCGNAADECGALGQEVGDQERRGLLVGGELDGDPGEVRVQLGAFEGFHGSCLSSVQLGLCREFQGVSGCGRGRATSRSAPLAVSR
ncbi:HD domain-containing protein [Streptomyces arboris]|uniref:HD domain-containing protein n=1 Tax=Streptomyces arboris TaxID=2600619 RepID=UPI003C2BECCB